MFTQSVADTVNVEYVAGDTNLGHDDQIHSNSFATQEVNNNSTDIHSLNLIVAYSILG